MEFTITKPRRHEGTKVVAIGNQMRRSFQANPVVIVPSCHRAIVIVGGSGAC